MVPHIFSMASMLLLLLLTVININTVHSKRYDLSPGWTIKESSDPATSKAAKYRILTAENGEQVVSDKGSFSLSFYDPSGTDDYFLAVLLHVGKDKPATPPSLVVPVWIANYNSSLSNGATLMLTKTHRKLILLDGGTSGALKWNSGATGVSGIELDESGNLALYDENGVVWQSFHQPTNVLVPGQQLKTGTSMISLNQSSPSSMKPGQFAGTMEASGFVLYVLPESEVTMANILRKPQPYRVWSIFGTPGNSLELARKSCSSSAAVMTFSSNSINISYEHSSSCGADMKVFQHPGGGSSDAPRYLKLEENGDLVLYEFDDGSQTWNAVFHFSEKAEDSCKLPTTCGSYGFCSSQGKCKCIGDSGVEDSSGSCTPPPGVSVSCLANEAKNHHFVPVDGATYFSNLFVRADKEKSSAEDCKSLCISNCSCAAAFYRKRSGSCFLVDELMGSLTMDPMQPDSTAFVKIQNSRLVLEPVESTAKEVTSKSARTAIVFLSVFCVGLIVTLVGVFWFVKSRYPQAYNKLMRRA